MIVTIPKRQISSDEVQARVKALNAVLWELRTPHAEIRRNLATIRDELEGVLKQCQS